MSIVLRCGGQLLNVIFSLLSVRCIQWSGFALIGVSCRCVIDVVLLGLVSCTRLMQTLITVCSASFHLLLLEFDILKLRPLLIHWSLKYQGVEPPNSQGVSCRPKFECGMTFPYIVFDTGTLDWFKGAVNRWLLPRLVYSSVSRGADACVITKIIYKQLCFSSWACAAGFNNNNNNNNNYSARYVRGPIGRPVQCVPGK